MGRFNKVPLAYSRLSNDIRLIITRQWVRTWKAAIVSYVATLTDCNRTKLSEVTKIRSHYGRAFTV
jgi:hypothetical protein